MSGLALSLKTTERAAADAVSAPRVLLLIAGHTGQVGSALVKQLDSIVPQWAREHNLMLHIAAQVNRQRILWRSPENGEQMLSRRRQDWPEILARFAGLPGRMHLLVDCTADAELACYHAECLRHGTSVITANKLALSGTQREYYALQNAARHSDAHYVCETTVGAALPVLGPVRDLAARGERVQRVEALISGTLSFILHRVNNGTRFSAAVREARTRGYSEPHPAEDLKGTDSARKLLILLRTAGLAWESDNIPVESLLPEELVAEPDAEHFLVGLTAHDDEWSRRAEAARKRGLRLAYLARFDGRSTSVGISHVSASDPFALLAPGENLVRVWTNRYQPVPLSIAGPGAGPELTAAGLLTDTFKTATQTV